MTTGTPLPAFKHDPLPEHKSHFRLLHIICGDFGQHVECEISTWPIGEAPPYYAISYTWGDAHETKEITVNGSRLEVRRNCEYALQQAFATKACKYVWMDAICINQTAEEKNHQVGIMDQIYSGAKHVLACVGPHENNSKILPKFIKKHRSLLTEIDGLPRPWWYIDYSFILPGGHNYMFPVPAGHNYVFPVAMDHKKIFLRCLLSVNGRTRHAVYQSFCSFMRRPYFTRLWIMQELNLAFRVSFCFGAATERAEDILALFWVLKFWAFSGLRYPKPEFSPRTWKITTMAILYSSSTPSSELIGEILCLLSSFRHMGCPAIDIEFEKTIPFDRLRLACTERKQSFHRLLFEAQAECSDPRDRLFGLLSFVYWQPGQEPKADYGKDRYEVALDAARLLPDCTLDTRRRLCRIFQITGEEASLRRTLGLRSSTSLSTLRSNHRDSDNGALHQSVRKGVWGGLEVRGTAEALESSDTSGSGGLKCFVSFQEHEDSCILKFKDGQDMISLRGPLDTRIGDWLVFEEKSNARWVNYLGLVIRESESGRYSLVGQIFIKGFSSMPSQLLLWNIVITRFDAILDSEDFMLLGWTAHQLESNSITQDQISEFVNRRICAWDGSSYFTKQARIAQLMQR